MGQSWDSISPVSDPFHRFSGPSSPWSSHNDEIDHVQKACPSRPQCAPGGPNQLQRPTVGAGNQRWAGSIFRATKKSETTLEVLNKTTLVNFCMYCFGLSFYIYQKYCNLYFTYHPTEVPSSSQQETAGGGNSSAPGQVFCSTGAPLSETLSSFCYHFFGKRFCLVFQGPPVETWPRSADCIRHKTYKLA